MRHTSYKSVILVAGIHVEAMASVSLQDSTPLHVYASLVTMETGVKAKSTLALGILVKTAACAPQ